MNAGPTTIDGSPPSCGGYAPDWGKPYGFWKTLGIGICIFTLTHYVVWLSNPLMQSILFPLLMSDKDFAFETPDIDLILRQGLFFGIGGCIMGVVGSLFVALAVFQSNTPARTYFGSGTVKIRQTGLYVSVSVLLFIAFWLLIRPMQGTPDYWSNLYRSAHPLVWLWIGLGILGPLYEELFYRGFLYAGMCQSFLGPKGAIVVVALLFAVSHYHYGVLGVAWIFILGMLLGVARHRSDTVRIPILMHMAYNLVFLAFCDASV